MAKRLARGGRRDEVPSRSILTRAVDSVFDFVRLAEFEILFVFFFVVAYVIFKDLIIHPTLPTPTCLRPVAYGEFFVSGVDIKETSRPEYNEMLVKKPDWWPY